MLVKKMVDGVEVEVEENEPTVMEGMEDLLEDFEVSKNPEVGDLLNFLNEPDKEKELPKEKEKEKEKEPEQKPEDKEKEQELEKEKEVEKPAEKEKEPTVEERYEAQLSAMREEMNKLIASMAREGKPQIFPAVENKETPPVEKKEEVKKPINVTDTLKKLLDKKEFLTKEQMDEVIDHPEHINEAIYKNREEMVGAMAEVLEDLTTNLPLLINVMVNRELVMDKAVTSFYEANKDLAPFGGVVQYVFKELEASHPKDKPYEELFKNVAVESRKRLGLKEPLRSEDGGQPISTSANSKKPAFAGSKQTATPLAKDNGKKMFDENAVDLFFDENK